MLSRYNYYCFGAVLCFMFEERIQFPPGFVESFCKRNRIRKLSFFGSVLRNDFRANSDIDILVEFEPGNVPGYFKLFDMQDELSKVLGHTVDLRTTNEISSHSIQTVQREARTLQA